MTEASQTIEQSEPFGMSMPNGFMSPCRDTDGLDVRNGNVDPVGNAVPLVLPLAGGSAASVMTTAAAEGGGESSFDPDGAAVFAGGENTGAGAIGPAVARSEGEASVQRSKEAHYRARLAELKAAYALAGKADCDARAHRNDLLVGVASLVDEKEFKLKAFCDAVDLACTTATQRNPHLAVIQKVMEGIDRKHASKLGIGLKFALQECGGVGKLREHLEKHSIEECVTLARKATRGNPRTRKSRLTILDAPLMAEGRVSLTIDVINGTARFVGLVTANNGLAAIVNPLAPPVGGTSDAPTTDEEPVQARGTHTSSRDHEAAPDFRRDDVAGEPPAALEVPAAA